MSSTILLLPGDGIGPEIMAEAERVLDFLVQAGDLDATLVSALVGGAAIDSEGVPLPDTTLALAREADAILLGAVGGPRWDTIERDIRPERGLLKLRATLEVFANLRPAIAQRQLAASSSLRPEVVAGLDVMILRELTGGIYFGQPRGITTDGPSVAGGGNERRGFNTMTYSEGEIERIARVGFDMARQRKHRLCSVDKANVLETSELWREVVTALADQYPDVELSHMYVDNAAMQLARNPAQFDVIVTENMFGDILSDLASMLSGSIGMLPSASLDANGKGLFEPIHGAAPDIAGQGVANPLATILSVAMMLRYSLKLPELAARVEAAVSATLDAGLRTADIAPAPGSTESCELVGTRAMGDAVLAHLANP